MFSCLNPDIKWNIMDAVLVMFGLLATWQRQQQNKARQGIL